MLAYNHQKFIAEFKTLLEPGSSTAQSMLVFLKRKLAQFNLTDSYSPTWVLSETYMRAMKLLETGVHIEKPIAWTRKTAYNVIREQRRECGKFRQIDEESIAESQTNYYSITFEEIEEEFVKVNLAFEMLETGEQEILNLKLIENLSWEEIRVHLISEKGVDLTEAALRKRKERALKRLRSIYHSLQYQPV